MLLALGGVVAASVPLDSWDVTGVGAGLLAILVVGLLAALFGLVIGAVYGAILTVPLWLVAILARRAPSALRCAVLGVTATATVLGFYAFVLAPGNATTGFFGVVFGLLPAAAAGAYATVMAPRLFRPE